MPASCRPGHLGNTASTRTGSNSITIAIPPPLTLGPGMHPTLSHVFSVQNVAFPNDENKDIMADQDDSTFRHGARRLAAVTVETYNAELRDSEGFISDRASKRAF